MTGSDAAPVVTQGWVPDPAPERPAPAGPPAGSAVPLDPPADPVVPFDQLLDPSRAAAGETALDQASDVPLAAPSTAADPAEAVEPVTVAHVDDGEEPGDVGGADERGDDTVRAVGDQAGPDVVEWHVHENGRWMIGDGGNMARLVPRATLRARGVPADTELDGATLNAVTYRAASLRGFSHQEWGKPRQDAFAVRVTRSQTWLTACVADGVGEVPRSDVASRLAADVVSGVLADGLEPYDVLVDDAAWRSAVLDLPWREARRAANAALAVRARTMLEAVYRGKDDEQALAALPDELPLSHVRTVLATTAVALVVSTLPGADDRHPFAVCVLAGDSAGYRFAGGRWRPVVAPKDVTGDTQNNSVRPLPLAGAPLALQIGRMPAGEAVALFSDGVSDALGSGRGVVGRFLASRWRAAPDLLAFGGHVGFYRRGFHDDRTAVVVWADPAEVGR